MASSGKSKIEIILSAVDAGLTAGMNAAVGAVNRLPGAIGQASKQIKANLAAMSADVKSMGLMKETAFADKNMATLGIKPFADVRAEMAKNTQAYRDLATSGRLSAAEQAQALETLRAKNRALYTTISQQSPLSQARSTLGVASSAEIEAEVAKIKGAYATMATSGKASMAELAAAKANMTKRLEELTGKTLTWRDSVAQSADSLGGLQAGIVAALAAFGGFNIFKEMVAGAISFNSTIEQSQIGIASLIRTFGAAGNGADAYDKSMAMAADIQKRLQIEGLKTTATYQELLVALQEGIGPALKAGFNPDQIVQFTSRMTQAATALGMPMNQLGQEIRSILEGTIDQNSRVAKSLGITNEKVKELAAQGKLYDYLSTRLLAFGEAGDAMAKTFSGAMSNVKDAVQMDLGTAFDKSYKAATDFLLKIQSAFVTIDTKAGTFTFNEKIIAAFNKVDAAITKVLGKFSGTELSGMISSFVGVLSGVAAEMVNFVAHLASLWQLMGPLVPAIASVVAQLFLWQGAFKVLVSLPLLIVGSLLKLQATWVGLIGSISKGLAVFSFESIVAGIGKVSLAVQAFAAANPLLLAVAAALGVGAIAVKLFADNSLAASKAHSEAAASIQRSKVGLEEEIQTLEDLRAKLLLAKLGSEEHVNAEAKLASILPGVNQKIDAQGRILNVTADSYATNNSRLKEYIDLKKREVQVLTGLQMADQAKAYFKVDDALKKFSADFMKLYGFNTKSWWSTSLLSVDKWSGAFDMNKKKLGDFKEALNSTGAAFHKTLSQMAKDGVTADQLGGMLDIAKIAPSLKNKIITEFKAITTGAQTEATNQVKLTDTQLKEMEGKYKAYSQNIIRLQGEIEAKQRDFLTEIQGIKREGMTPFAANEDLKKQEQEYLGLAKAEREAGKAAADAGDMIGAKLHNDAAGDWLSKAATAARGFNGEIRNSNQALEEQARKAKDAADSAENQLKMMEADAKLNGSSPQFDAVIEAKRQEAEQLKTVSDSYAARVAVVNSEVLVSAQQQRDTRIKYETDVYNESIKLKKQEQEENQKANEALNAKAKANDPSFAGFQKSLDESEQKYMEFWGNAHQLASEKLDAIAEKAKVTMQTLTLPVDQWETDGQKILARMTEIFGKIDGIITQTFADRTMNVIVHQVQQQAIGGLVQGFARGGMVVRNLIQHLATGGGVRNILAGGFLPGFGGGDRRLLMGEDGEVMINKYATQAAGVDTALAFNAGRWDIVVRNLLSKIKGDVFASMGYELGGIVGHLPTAHLQYLSAGGAVSGSGSSGDTVTLNFNFGPGSSARAVSTRDDAARIRKAFERMERLRS